MKLWNSLTHRRRVLILSPIVLISLFGSTYGALTNTKLGTIAWLVGLLALTLFCPVWGFSLGRINTGRGNYYD